MMRLSLYNLDIGKALKRIVFGVAIATLAGCATVEDVRRASDLIRADNELTRLLVEVRPDNPNDAALYLAGVAADAKAEATTLADSEPADALAYYRIAATAYWRSGKPEVANDLFAVVDAGTKLCADLGDKAPDRDCLFLRLVIPFAALEASANNHELEDSLGSVNFHDDIDTTNEIDVMKKVRLALRETKPLVEKILVVGSDDRLLTHPSMREYYCTNVKIAYQFYQARASVHVVKVREFERRFSRRRNELGTTVEDAEELNKFVGSIPNYCLALGDIHFTEDER